MMLRTTLPNEIEPLKDMVLEHYQRFEQEHQRAQCEYQRAELLKSRVELLERRIFGTRSEQLHREQASGQQMLEFVDLPAKPETAPPAERVVPSEQRKRHGGGRKPIPDHLLRKRLEHTLPEEQRRCCECGDVMQPFGEELSEQLETIPAQLYVIQHARIKYGCKKCESSPLTAEVPHKVIDKGLAGPGLLAEIAVQKFEDHLPLYRQEKIFERHGCHIPRSTMCSWMGVVAELLQPVYRHMAAQVLCSRKIHTDDTTIQVQAPGSHKTKTGRLWVYLGDAEHPHTVFEYTPNRSRDGPARFLEKYSGYLQADAYAGYDGIYAGKQVIEVACWAHARRKFFEARETEARADQMLALIGELYAVETQAREQTMNWEDRRQLRQLKTVPVLSRIKAWLDERKQDALPKGPLGQAVRYTLNQWAALNRFVEDGILEADNNLAENALRRVALGRKNYLFLGNDAGGKRAAIIYSLLASCRRHGVNPSDYLADVLVRISSHPAHLVHELAPANWTPPAAVPASLQ